MAKQQHNKAEKPPQGVVQQAVPNAVGYDFTTWCNARLDYLTMIMRNIATVRRSLPDDQVASLALIAIAQQIDAVRTEIVEARHAGAAVASVQDVVELRERHQWVQTGVRASK